jgi:hypothetical protein
VWQVSTDGGADPRFSRAGDRLFYSRGHDLMEVPIALEETPRLGTPRVVVSDEAERLRLDLGYDVAPDGRGFVAVREVLDRKTTVPTLTLVESWFAEFRDGLPAPRADT